MFGLTVGFPRPGEWADRQHKNSRGNHCGRRFPLLCQVLIYFLVHSCLQVCFLQHFLSPFLSHFLSHFFWQHSTLSFLQHSFFTGVWAETEMAKTAVRAKSIIFFIMERCLKGLCSMFYRRRRYNVSSVDAAFHSIIFIKCPQKRHILPVSFFKANGFCVHLPAHGG